jgi:hypothetical protein
LNQPLGSISIYGVNVFVKWCQRRTEACHMTVIMATEMPTAMSPYSAACSSFKKRTRLRLVVPASQFAALCAVIGINGDLPTR